MIVDPSRVFFDSNPSEHYHVYDVDTGELTDIDPSHVSLGALPRLPEGRALERIDLVVRVRRQVSAQPE